MKKCLQAKIAASIIFAICTTQTVYAEISWNGFISAGGGIANIDGSEDTFLNDYEESLTFSPNTKLGLQLSTPINDKLSATGQMIARGSEDYQLEMAWAYLSYSASDSTTVRAGRFRTPFYLYSDYLDVGYAYHWISPPEDVYDLPADSIDGIDLVYQTALGITDITTQVYVGSINSSFIAVDDIEIGVRIRDQAGLALTLNYEWLTLRASHHEAQKVSFDGLEGIPLPAPLGSISGLQASLNTLTTATGNPGYANAASSLTAEEVKYTFDEVALKIEWNNILFVTELAKLEPESGIIGAQDTLLISLGYTIGPVILHITQTQTDDKTANTSSLIPTNIPGTEATSLLLAGAVDAIAQNFAQPDRTTNTIGVRWDFDSSAALKVEYLDISDDTGADGNIIRFVIDSVF